MIVGYVYHIYPSYINFNEISPFFIFSTFHLLKIFTPIVQQKNYTCIHKFHQQQFSFFPSLSNTNFNIFFSATAGTAHDSLLCLYSHLQNKFHTLSSKSYIGVYLNQTPMLFGGQLLVCGMLFLRTILNLSTLSIFATFFTRKIIQVFKRIISLYLSDILRVFFHALFSRN